MHRHLHKVHKVKAEKITGICLSDTLVPGWLAIIAVIAVAGAQSPGSDSIRSISASDLLQLTTWITP